MNTLETTISYKSRTQLLTAWKIKSNAEVHGTYFASIKAKQQGLNLDTVLYTLFGRYSKVKKINSI